MPLEGVRILAVSQFGAGPFGTMLLADLGAEVIKIEDPAAGGDVARYVPPYRVDGDSLYFQSFNRNKKSLSLNLRASEGREIFHRLVEISDAVFNNLRGDEPRKLGLDYRSLKNFNRRVVCCSLSGFGSQGPRASEPGYDYLIQACAGYMSLTGEPDGPPTKCGISVVDHAAGIAAALGLVAGIFNAQRTGIGCDVDISLFDTAISMLSYLAVWNLNRGYIPQRLPDSAHQTLVPVQSFRTKSGHIVIFCAKEKFWRNLCQALEVPELIEDARFASFEQRWRNRELLIALLQRIFLEKTAEEWLGLLRGKVPCAVVNSIEQALRDPQLLAREMIIEVEHPVFGRIKEVGCPIKFSGVGRQHAPAPALGQDTEAILTEYLNCSRAQIAELKNKGVI